MLWKCIAKPRAKANTNQESWYHQLPSSRAAKFPQRMSNPRNNHDKPQQNRSKSSCNMEPNNCGLQHLKAAKKRHTSTKSWNHYPKYGEEV
jgi:hypothetical protein